MRLKFAVFCVLFCPCAFPQERPKGITVSTWVREDIFAGFLEGDMARHAVGVQKLEAIPAQTPRAADALAWQGGAALHLAIRAHEAGDSKGFDAQYAKALEHFAKGAAIVAEVPAFAQGFFAIRGGSFAVFSDRLPASLRKVGWQRVREDYTALRAAQNAFWKQLPVHARAEVGAGLAQAAYRLGETDLARKLTAELANEFPNTPYAVFATRWLNKPETIEKSKVTCASCHDAGRLQATLIRN